LPRKPGKPTVPTERLPTNAEQVSDEGVRRRIPPGAVTYAKLLLDIEAIFDRGVGPQA
jgi:hypothetical protein